MGLQAQLPLRVAFAGLDRQRGVEGGQRTVHRLNEEIIEVQAFVGRQVLLGLRDYDLDFIALADHQLGTHLRADADPVDAGRHRQGAVGFDGDLEAHRLHRGDQLQVQLQQRLAAGEDHVFAGRVSVRPQRVDGRRQRFGRGELAAALAVGADEVGVAELADGAGAVAFAAGPQIAAGKTAEHGGTPGMGALALQGVKDFFDTVSHGISSAGGAGGRRIPVDNPLLYPRRRPAGISRPAGGDYLLNEWKILIFRNAALQQQGYVVGAPRIAGASTCYGGFMRLLPPTMLPLTILAGAILSGAMLATPPLSAPMAWRVEAMMAGAALLAAVALWLAWRHYRLRVTVAELHTELTRERALRGGAEQALIDTHASLCRLAAQQGEVQNAERRRIARDIHDDLGQHLLTLKMDIATLQAGAAIQTLANPLDERLGQLGQRIDLAVLNEGLGRALTHHLADFARLSGIRCELMADADALCAARDCGADTMIYRVVQEALANVARHARASSVSVALSRQPQRLAMTVSDNGVGLPVAAGASRCGRGLDGMQERVSGAGGRLEILSAPGRGTTLLISVPLEAA